MVLQIDEELLQEVVNMGFDRNQLLESLCNRIQNEVTKEELNAKMGEKNGAGDDLFKELWRLCRAINGCSLCSRQSFYFPQGHIELLPEPTEQDLRQMKNQKSPKYDLPSNKIFKEQDFFLFYQKVNNFY
ncbi:hypothetical protein HN873_012261 [Arachis hypogaea]